MALRNFKNFALTTLGAGIDAVATTNMNLGAGGAAKLPSAPFTGIVWNSTDFATPDLDPGAEVLLFTSVTSDTVNAFTRAQEGTAAVAHNTVGKTYKLLATLTADLITTHLPRTLLSAKGVVGVSATVAASVMPGSAAFSIPAGFLGVGDRVVIEMDLIRRGAQNTQGMLHNLLWNGASVYGGTLASGATENQVRIRADALVQSATSEAVNCTVHRDASWTGNRILSTAALATAITVDLQSWWGAATTDTLGLEHVLLLVYKAST